MGGHFSPHDALGHDFDLGMMLLEFDSYQDQETDLTEYDPTKLGHAGKFTSHVENLFREFFEWREVRQIQVALENQVIDDYYISNQLNELPDVFDEDLRNRITLELRHCVASTQSHPRDKSVSPVFDTLSYAQASIDNHGKILHDVLMEPLVMRATNLPSERLLAKYHRLFWAPLYYPETLLANISEGLTLKPTQFHHPIGSTIGQLSRKLYSEISTSKRCTIIPELTSVQRSGSNWSVNNELQTTQLSSSLPQNTLASLLSIESAQLKRSSYLIIFLALQGEVDCGVLFNASSSGQFFRLVNQSRLRGEEDGITYMTVEYNLDLVNSNDNEFVNNKRYLDELREFIERFELGQFKLLASSVLELRDKIVFPELDNARLAVENSRQLDGIPIELMGPSLGMIGSALNDQIVQALKYVKLNL